MDVEGRIVVVADEEGLLEAGQALLWTKTVLKEGEAVVCART